MTERECSLCGSFLLYEEGEPSFDLCFSCDEILAREKELDDDDALVYEEY